MAGKSLTSRGGGNRIALWLFQDRGFYEPYQSHHTSSGFRSEPFVFGTVLFLIGDGQTGHLVVPVVKCQGVDSAAE
jgi:hypothetical protein